MNLLKRKLEEIQNSSQSNKNRWLIGASAVAMVVVVFLWLVYLDQIIRPSGVGPAPDASVSNWQVFKNGLKIVFESIKNDLSILISKITGSRTIVIE